MRIVTDHEAQTISYPAPGSRPSRRSGVEPTAPHVVVLFGATGDLARRKLLPGMAHLAISALAPDIRIVGTSIEDYDDDTFRAFTKAALDEFGNHPMTEDRKSTRLNSSHVSQSRMPSSA